MNKSLYSVTMAIPHPISISTPPIGVIAPSTLIPESTSRYREELNIPEPISSIRAARFRDSVAAVMFIESVRSRSTPMPCTIRYKVAVFQTSR